MANNQGSAGVTATEIDLSGPVVQQPTGIPAGVIGTSPKGPAFVPITVGTQSDFTAKFGAVDGTHFGPLAVNEWLRNANAATFLRVLGIGEGKTREADGSVVRAGFTVGEELPSTSGVISSNPYANAGGPDGRLYFLGAFMSESAGSTIFSSAGLQGPGSVTPNVNSAVPIIRGVLMAPSGVILRLSSSAAASAKPASSYVANNATAQGDIVGDVKITPTTNSRQEFVLILNGHKGTDPAYPNVITASLDARSDDNYFSGKFNRDPYKIQEAGHYLYANWDISPVTAFVTGTVLVGGAYGADVAGGKEPSVFLTTASLTWNSGSTFVPNYEGFADRFEHAKSPWVISQRFGGKPADLFRFHAVDAGAEISNLYKISIENLSPGEYGSFDVRVRQWADRDDDIKPLETFTRVNLDPRSDRYIAKVIGDAHVFFDFDREQSAQAVVIEGNYPAQSNYIRVEVSSNVENGIVDPTALPVGFRGIEHLVTSGSAPLASNDGGGRLVTSNLLKRSVTPPLPMRLNIAAGSGARASVNPALYWGTQFEHIRSLATPNDSTRKNESLKSFVKYFPDYSTEFANFIVGDNTGAADTAELGIVDADRFCNNLFTLENVQVVTGSSGLADTRKWQQATYVRGGNITANSANKTRAFKVDDITSSNKRFAKFTFPLQGGFDGVNLFDRQESRITNIAVTADMDNTPRGLQDGPSVSAYTKAIEVMKNVVNADVQLLAIPGIRHEVVTDLAADAVRERFDALYIMDIRQYDNNVTEVTSSAQRPSVAATVQEFSGRNIDNSFAAAYFPDVTMRAPNGTLVTAPPSVAVLGALSLNDKPGVGHPWFAPAGEVRGVLPTTRLANVRLSKPNMDVLYDARINPLATVTPNGGGVIVWGQKTLQATASALDRINVRRLLIEIRRQVRDISQTILFEPNRAATLARFSAAITPRLQRIQALAGLERFRVIIDSSTTTQADVENNTVRGKIFVQPTKSVEFVSLDFVVTNNIQ